MDEVVQVRIVVPLTFAIEAVGAVVFWVIVVLAVLVQPLELVTVTV